MSALFLGRPCGLDHGVGMRLFAVTVLISALLLVSSAHAQDLRKGLKAYKRGDYATALKEWRPLAESGHAGAQYNLGFNYVQGKGVEKNLVEAYFWFELAARQGKRIATQLRDGISKKMTSKQIDQALLGFYLK